MSICWDKKGNVGFAINRPVGTGVTWTMTGKTWIQTRKKWKHHTWLIQFCLVVGKFGVQYQGQQHVEHLKQILQQAYELSINWTGSKYVGLKIQWDYKNCAVHMLMLGHIQKVLTQFQHAKLKWPQYQPNPHVPFQYGQKQQFVMPDHNTTPLDMKETKFIQEVMGMFLFYAWAIDSTMLTALNAIASQQANPTKKMLKQMLKWMLKQTKHFLDYAATKDKAVVTYHAIDMILAVHNNALYLREPKAWSPARGHFFLSADMTFSLNNGVIFNTAQIIKKGHVVSCGSGIGGTIH